MKRALALVGLVAMIPGLNAWAFETQASGLPAVKPKKVASRAPASVAPAIEKITPDPSVQDKARAAGLGQIPVQSFLQKTQRETDLASQFVILGIEAYRQMAKYPRTYGKDTLATLARALLKSKVNSTGERAQIDNGRIHLPPRAGKKSEVIWLAHNEQGLNLIDINLDRVFDTEVNPTEADRKAIAINAFLISEGMDHDKAALIARQATGAP